MGLTLRGANSPDSIAKFGFLLQNLPSFPDDISLEGHDLGPVRVISYDPIGQNLAAFLYRYHYRSTRPSFGFGASRSVQVAYSFPRRKPVPIPYNFQVDRARYGNVITQFVSILQGDYNVSAVDFRGRPENDVMHSKSGGVVRLLDEQDLYPLSDTFPVSYHGLSGPGILNRHEVLGQAPVFYVQEIQDNGYASYPVSFSEFFTMPVQTDTEILSDFLSRLQDEGSPSWDFSGTHYFGGVSFTGPLWGWLVRDITVKFSRGVLSQIKYYLWNATNHSSGPYSGRFSYSQGFVTIDFTVVDVPGPAWVPENVPAYPLPFQKLVVTRTWDIQFGPTDSMTPYLADGVAFNFGNPSAGTIDYVSRFVKDEVEILQPLLLTVPTVDGPTDSSSALIPLALPSNRLTFGGSNRLLDFETQCNSLMPHFRPASYLAVSKAVSDYADIIRTNHLETIAEIDDLLQIIPDRQKLAVFATSLYSGDFKNAGLSLLDFLSEAYLIKKFGIDPSIKSGREAMTKASLIRERFRSLYSPVTLHSKFVYELPNGTFEYDNCVLVVRCKLRVSYDESTFLAGILKARALGLFPGLAAIWDIVTLSFLVDIVTNLGERFTSVDAQASILALRTSGFVYSYTVYAPLSDSFLSNFNLKSDSYLPEGDDEPHLRFYRREFSNQKPGLRNSKFDFLQAHNPVDFGILGSLLWQILR